MEVASCFHQPWWSTACGYEWAASLHQSTFENNAFHVVGDVLSETPRCGYIHKSDGEVVYSNTARACKKGEEVVRWWSGIEQEPGFEEQRVVRRRPAIGIIKRAKSHAESESNSNSNACSSAREQHQFSRMQRILHISKGAKKVSSERWFCRKCFTRPVR